MTCRFRLIRHCYVSQSTNRVSVSSDDDSSKTCQRRMSSAYVHVGELSSSPVECDDVPVPVGMWRSSIRRLALSRPHPVNDLNHDRKI